MARNRSGVDWTARKLSQAGSSAAERWKWASFLLDFGSVFARFANDDPPFRRRESGTETGVGVGSNGNAKRWGGLRRIGITIGL